MLVDVIDPVFLERPEDFIVPVDVGGLVDLLGAGGF